jgi:hypothetical protein
MTTRTAILIVAIALVAVAAIMLLSNEEPGAPATVEAPGANVQSTDGGVKIEAPGVKVEATDEGVSVKAPGVEIEVPAGEPAKPSP